MTAILATFSDFKLVKTRKVAQLVLEVPLEQADAALATLGGLPRPDAEKWVGIAPVDPAVAVQQQSGGAPHASVKDGDKPGHRRNSAAHAMCKRPDFQEWLRSSFPAAWRDHSDGLADANPEAVAASVVREHCGVAHRSDLDTSEPAGLAWDTLRSLFYEQTHMAERR